MSRLHGLYCIRSVEDRYFASKREHAVYAAGNWRTAEEKRQEVARLWAVPPDDLVVEKYSLFPDETWLWGD